MELSTAAVLKSGGPSGRGEMLRKCLLVFVCVRTRVSECVWRVCVHLRESHRDRVGHGPLLLPSLLLLRDVLFRHPREVQTPGYVVRCQLQGELGSGDSDSLISRGVLPVSCPGSWPISGLGFLVFPSILRCPVSIL